MIITLKFCLYKFNMFSKIKFAKFKTNCKTCYTLPEEIIPNLSWEKFQTLPYRKRLKLYLGSAQHIEEIKYFIPKKHLELKKHAIPDSLYLVDSRIAKDIAKHILPAVKGTNQVICETNAGLGFITSELLDNGLQKIRLYENDSDFRLTLKEFNKAYPGKVELFVKDFFHMWKMSYMDKMDKGGRVNEFLKGLPKRNWSDDPFITVIGTMSKLDFLSYAFKMISFHDEIAAYGRMQLFVIMRPGDYIKLTAGPHCNLHTYQIISILADTFCEFKLIEKYPRIAFLPWESSSKQSARTKSFKKFDMDKLYLVHIEFKRQLPMKSELLLPFYFYVRQLFKRGTTPVIQQLEKWVSGVGQRIILPKEHEDCLNNIDIFTKSGQLKPLQLVELFKILYDHPGYASSALTAMVEAEVLRKETIDTSIAETYVASVPSFSIKQDIEKL